MVFYGEEIGMGENLKLDGRMAVRAPMQWTSYDSGGFSNAERDELVRPILAEGDYGFEYVSVSKQRGDADSLVRWMATLMRVRRECGEIGAGEWSLVETGNDAIFAVRYDSPASSLMILNNLSPDRHTISLGLTERELMTTTDLFTDRNYGALAEKGGRMRMDGYGFRWVRLSGTY